MELRKFYCGKKQETKKLCFKNIKTEGQTQLIHMRTENYQDKQYIHPVKREAGWQKKLLYT
jgi:hypothetical protein